MWLSMQLTFGVLYGLCMCPLTKLLCVLLTKLEKLFKFDNCLDLDMANSRLLKPNLFYLFSNTFLHTIQRYSVIS